MKKRRAPTLGFTIVELIIVIVVIGILASIGIVAYNGVQKKAGVVSMQSDLSNTALLMAGQRSHNGAYPSVLPSEVRPSAGVTLKLESTGVYSGLTPVQSGVLFQNICQELISEGYGVGTNQGGSTEQYITGCIVYNYNSLHINGWHSNHFSVPISSTSIKAWYSANVPADSWRPNKQQIYQDFANKLSSRYIAKGGTFPVTTFWDDWASPGNGVEQQPLPAPSSGSQYCLEARHTRLPGVVWHIANGGSPTESACL